MKRIFTAIAISEETRAQAAKYIETLRGEFSQIRAGWEQTEKLHLTLKFLGDIDEDQLAKLTFAVSETAKRISDFKLRISKTGVFPSARNARILWLGVRDEAASLQTLNEILEIECEKEGFSKEKKDFKAHLTVARLREPQKSKELIRKHLQKEFETNEFAAGAIVVYESRLLPQGSVYKVISKHQLKAETPIKTD